MTDAKHSVPNAPLSAPEFGEPETGLTNVPDPAITPAEHPTDKPQRGDGSAVPAGWENSTTSPVATEPQPGEGQRGPSGDETGDSGEDSIPG